MGIGKMNTFLEPLEHASRADPPFDIGRRLFQLELSTAGRERLQAADLTKGCVMVANHPRGILDIFATGAWFTDQTSQPVKCLANRAITQFIPALKPHVVPVNNMGLRGEERSAFNREAFEEATSFLRSGGVLGVCPAGEVASLRIWSPEGWFRLSDHPWNPSFVRLARELQLPIVPIHVSGRNRAGYYLLRLFGRIFGRLANFRELVASGNEHIVVSVGQHLDFEDYGELPADEVARRVRQNLYAASE